MFKRAKVQKKNDITSFLHRSMKKLHTPSQSFDPFEVWNVAVLRLGMCHLSPPLASREASKELARRYCSIVKVNDRYFVDRDGFSVTCSFSLPKYIKRWLSIFSVL